MTVPKIPIRVASTAVHNAAKAMARDVTAISGWDSSSFPSSLYEEVPSSVADKVKTRATKKDKAVRSVIRLHKLAKRPRLEDDGMHRVDAMVQCAG